MKGFSFTNLKLGNILPVLLGVALVFGIFLGSQQELSWAAPEQNPDQQTVPPRPPTPEPSPSPEPPEPSPPPEPPVQFPEDDDSDDDGEAPPLAQSPEPNYGADDGVLPPAQALEQENGTNDETLPSTRPLEQEVGTDDETSSVQPFEEEDEGDNAPITLQQADLSLSKTVNNATPKVGEAITFTIVVSNSGPSNATNVMVGDLWPAGLELNLVTSSKGKFDGNTGVWTVNAIAPGQDVTLTLVGMVMNTGIITNSAEVITAFQVDPDSTPGNGLEGEDDQDNVQVVVSSDISATTQPWSNSTMLASTSGDDSRLLALTRNVSLLYWVYALILGIILIVIGLFLVNRA
jgi:uncharacterized repeat protein (TIGR01451 family)